MGETRCLCIAFFFCQPPLVSSFTLLWTIARFLDPFYTFSPAHRRVTRDFTLPYESIGIQFFNLHTHVTDLRDTMPCQRSLTHTHTHTHTNTHTHTHTHTHTRDLRDTMPSLRSLYKYLGKQRISLQVIDILSMHLC